MWRSVVSTKMISAALDLTVVGIDFDVDVRQSLYIGKVSKMTWRITKAVGSNITSRWTVD